MVDTLHSSLVGSDLHVPKAHHATHEPGGSDALAEDAAAATPSLRSLGSLATQAAPGTHTAPPFVASGASHAGGHVPDPGSTPGTKRFMREDATFAVPPTFTGSGASHAPGYVPDPGASAGATRYLREDSSWDVPVLPINHGENTQGPDVAIPGTSTYTTGPGGGLLAGTWQVLGKVVLTNSSGGAIDVTVRLYDATASVDYDSTRVTVPAGGSAEAVVFAIITSAGSIAALVQAKAASAGVSMIGSVGTSPSGRVTAIQLA